MVRGWTMPERLREVRWRGGRDRHINRVREMCAGVYTAARSVCVREMSEAPCGRVKKILPLLVGWGLNRADREGSPAGRGMPVMARCAIVVCTVGVRN